MGVHPDAEVDAEAELDSSVVIWAGTHVREFASIGPNTSLGQYVYVGPGTVIGADCKIQNGALLYEPARLADGVFIGPGVILTNDRRPRAINADGSAKKPSDWEPVGVTIEYGASIGAGAICVAPIVIGSWATVAAGAVVTADVASHALVAGVPARRIGWVGRTGMTLQSQPPYYRCPDTGELFLESEDGLRLVAVDE